MLIWGQENGVEEGVLVKPCWQHCSAASTLKLEESLIPGWKHYSHFLTNCKLMNVSDVLKQIFVS